MNSPTRAHTFRLISPDTAQARGRLEVLFEVTIGDEGIATAGGFRIYPPITTPPHFWSMVRWSLGLATVQTAPEDADLECSLHRHDRGIYHETKAELVHVVNRGRELRPGETVRILLSDCRAQALAMEQSPFHIEFDSRGEGDSRYVSTASRPDACPQPMRDKMQRLRATPPAMVRVTGAQAERIVVVLPSRVAVGQGFWLALRAEDRYGNVAELPAGSIHLRPSAPGLSLPRAIPWDGGPLCTRFEAFGRVEAPGCYWIDVVQSPGGLQGTSGVVGTQLRTAVQFGDIHGHTYASDGLGTQEQYFAYARDVAFSELTVLTDHSLFDDKIIELTERFNEDDRFATLFGREWGDHRGHRNVYAATAADVAAIDGPNVLELAAGRDVLVIPHHTNASTKNYWRNCDLSYHDEQTQRLIEVSQNRGSFEVEQVGGPVVDGGYGSSVQAALARGMRLGFVGGSDTHRGTPSGPSHPLDPYYNTWNSISGLTGVLTDTLSRDAVFSAMKLRRTYCTTGPRIVAEYLVNGEPMGSVLPAAERVSIEGFIGGCAPITGLEIIRNGEPVFSLQPDARVVRFSYEDPAPQPAYYYVRAWQSDGHYVYLSPVWVGL